MEWARHDEKFDKMASFLSDRKQSDQWIIDDENILDFWLLHSKGEDFRGYKTVFGGFVTLMRALQQSGLALATESYLPLGTDREKGEVDTQDRGGFIGHDEWESPFAVFEGDGLSEIKFFKRSSEQKPLEPLMSYGPDAVRVPLAFLRLESFGAVQAGITNDLQVKRGRDSLLGRLSCESAVSYADKTGDFSRLFEHVRRLQLASLHVLRSEGSSSSEPDGAVNEEARKAFEGIKRQGFSSDELDEGQIACFEQAGEALAAMSSLLAKLLGKIEKEINIETQFSGDREIFSNQFQKIYGDMT
jgi:hypothetical protein